MRLLSSLLLAGIGIVLMAGPASATPSSHSKDWTKLLEKFGDDHPGKHLGWFKQKDENPVSLVGFLDRDKSFSIGSWLESIKTSTSYDFKDHVSFGQTEWPDGSREWCEDGQGGGEKPPQVPEPTAALLFAAGALVVRRGLRR